MLKYTTHTEQNSMYNTPPCFSIYTAQLVLKWLEETVGGLDKMAAINQKKAGLIYSLIDQGKFYRGTADKDSRSLMNVTFRLPRRTGKEVHRRSDEKRHGRAEGPSLGGWLQGFHLQRLASETVAALVDFMNAFAKRMGRQAVIFRFS